jgi:hypothetical protein
VPTGSSPPSRATAPTGRVRPTSRLNSPPPQGFSLNTRTSSRLFFVLSLERSDDPAVTAVVRRVRDTAIAGFRAVIASLMPDDAPPARADEVVDELTALAVALSDGVFFADHLEPDSTDVDRMYRRLFQAVTALIPILLEEP